jgi:hypothetical protein
MADKILVEVEGIEPFECDEDLYNLSMMIVELLRDALGESKPQGNGAVVTALKAELSKLRKPRIMTTDVKLERDWRGELQGVTLVHHYEDGTNEVTH